MTSPRCSECVRNSRNASTIIAWTCGVPILAVHLLVIKKGLRGSFSPQHLCDESTFLYYLCTPAAGWWCRYPGPCHGKLRGNWCCNAQDRTCQWRCLYRSRTSLLVSRAVRGTRGVRMCVSVLTEISQRKAMWHCSPESVIFLIFLNLIFVLTYAVQCHTTNVGVGLSIVHIWHICHWSKAISEKKPTVIWRQSFPSAVYSAYTMSTFRPNAWWCKWYLHHHAPS